MGRSLEGGVCAEAQHVYIVDDIVTGQRTTVPLTRMGFYVSKSLLIVKELRNMFTLLHGQRKFQMEAIWAEALSAGSDDRVVI